MAAHVRLGGSKAHRWLACPASPRLEEEAGPQVYGPHAAEGTSAHSVGETALRTGKNADDFLGMEFEGFEVTAEMAEAVQVYVDWVRNASSVADATLMLEHRIDLSKLNPPEPMTGTADCLIVVPSLRLLIVADYKHGRGHVVEVNGNKQTRYYALGALLSLPAELRAGIDKVQMTIVQPRAFHPDGPVRSETIDLLELVDFADDILKAANAAQDPDAPAVPGDHCLFCAAAGNCRARSDQAVVLAQQEFSVVPQLSNMSTAEIAARVAEIEPKLGVVEAWLKEAKKHLEEQLKSGAEVPGWKLVQKRATRVWSDPAKVEEWALLEAGLDKADIYTAPELKSPAQLETLVGKKAFPASLTVSVSSGYNLAPASSSKPSVAISAADEFSTVNP